MSQLRGADHPRKHICRSTHTPQAGFALCPAPLVWSYRDISPWQVSREVWGDLCLSIHHTDAPACIGDVCQLHSIHTCLLVGNLMVHICCGLCNWMTAHRGLGINYTLERCSCGPGEDPEFVAYYLCLCSCSVWCRATTHCLYLHGFHKPHQAASAGGDATVCAGRAGLLSTGWVLWTFHVPS